MSLIENSSRLGIYLTDFVFVEEGNADYLEGTKLINITKLRFTASIMIGMDQFQHDLYNYKAVPAIQAFLLAINCLDEKQQRELSLKVEPRQ